MDAQLHNFSVLGALARVSGAVVARLFQVDRRNEVVCIVDTRAYGEVICTVERATGL